MKISFRRKALLMLLAVLLVLPTLSACGRKITLDDAEYTMGKLFSALGSGDYDGIASLMHKESGVTAGTIQSFLASVEDKHSANFEDGISNIRYTAHKELPYNGVPGGSKFRVDGTFNIGSVQNVPFIILLIMDSSGYGIGTIDFGGAVL